MWKIISPCFLRASNSPCAIIMKGCFQGRYEVICNAHIHRFFRIYLTDILGIYKPLMYSPSISLVPHINLSCSVNYNPLNFIWFPTLYILNAVPNTIQGVTSLGSAYNLLPSRIHTLMLKMMFAIWRAWEKTWGLCQSISWIGFRTIAPFCDEVEIPCMRVAVEASIPNDIRDFAPNPEKYKAMHVFHV